MLSLLYTWLVSPLALIYHVLFSAVMTLIPNHGIALIVLAIPHAVLLLPLRRAAKEFEAKEHKIREILDPQISAIKSASSGEDRHKKITALYQRYSYHPLLGIRESLSVLLQIPFMLATYWMVRETSSLEGLAFGAIRDLSKPDHLLGKINLFGEINALPFAMTAANLLTLFLTRGSTKRERNQGIILALAFCALLYAAPSALLIFWTANNTLSLFAAIWRLTRGKSNASQTKHSTALYSTITQYPWVGIYFLSTLVFALLLTMFGPSALYASEPAAYFHRGVLVILRASPPLLMALMITAMYIWKFSPTTYRPIISAGSFFIALLTVIQTTLPVPDYGVLNGADLSKFAKVPLLEKSLADLCTVGLAALVSTLAIRKISPTFIIRVLSIIAVALCVFPLWVGITNPRDLSKSKLGSITKALEYSSQDKNTVVIILDMFTGTHLDDIFKRQPSLRDKLDGFTWYRQTLAVGASTILGMPAIMGGHSATPQELNENQELPNSVKLSRVHTIMPKAFMSNGLDSSLINLPEYLNAQAVREDLLASGSQFNLIPQASKLAFTAGIHSVRPTYFPLAVSLFRISPNLLKSYVYQSGDWHGWYSFGNSFEKARQETRFLRSLPTMSSVRGDKGTFKVIYSDLTHCPYHLRGELLDFVPDPDPSTRGQPYGNDLKGAISLEHLYSEHHAMRFITEYLDWMRANRVYNNTKIIITSDHSWFDSAVLARAFDNKHSYPGRPDSLLLVKDFDAADSFAESTQLMSTADVPYIACKHIQPEKCEAIAKQRDTLRQIFEGVRIDNRELFHSIADQWILSKHPANQLKFDSFKVTGNMLTKTNWEKVVSQ